MSMRRMSCLSALLGVTLLAGLATAAVPYLLNYQGILADGAGKPLEGTHTLVFTVYRDSLSTIPIVWTETHTNVLVHQGLFNVILGRFTPFTDTMFSTQRWLAVRVDSDPNMQPRMRFTATAYALRAAVADSAVHAAGVGGSDGDWTISGADMYSAVSGNVGIGATAPGKKLQVGNNTVPNAEGMIRLASRSGTQGSNRIWDIGVPETDGDSSQEGYSFVVDDTAVGTGPEFMVKFGTGNVGIGTLTPAVKLDVAGTARVYVLQITGGADLAENFPASGGIEPGMVVAIDPDRPGRLRLAAGAYDRRVAGVVSGANGLGAGAVLGAGATGEDELPLALSGRAWVRCDASHGPIAPGDLLTTSNSPGHAAKVVDHARAQGAIIGKAMTRLDSGSGLVLVLISLQ